MTKVAYVDTSWLVAIAFEQSSRAGRGWKSAAARLTRFDRIVSSNLLEAELRSVCRREETVLPDSYLAGLSWILPDRSLGPEIARVLEHGYLRGADLWHLATALYLSPKATEISFLTFDERQRRIAKKLRFAS